MMVEDVSAETKPTGLSQFLKDVNDILNTFPANITSKFPFLEEKHSDDFSTEGVNIQLSVEEDYLHLPAEENIEKTNEHPAKKQRALRRDKRAERKLRVIITMQRYLQTEIQ